MARRITAAEVLKEREELRSELGHVPHGTGRGWSSMFWVYCDCPNCRDEYDPTGQHTADYLNMDPKSFYTDQSDLPSFAFSKTLAKESLFFSATPGFYFDNDARVRQRDAFLEQMTPPLALYPRHILHIGTDGVIDRFFLSEDKSHWTRHTWKGGHSVWYKEGENPPIPFDTANQALRLRLNELFA